MSSRPALPSACLNVCLCVRFNGKGGDTAGGEPHPTRPREECEEAGQRSRQVSGDGETVIPWLATPNYHYQQQKADDQVPA